MRFTPALTTLRTTAAALAATVLLASCAGDADPSTDTAPDAPSSQQPSSPATGGSVEPASPPATPTPEPSGPTLSITVEGDEVSPNSQEIDLAPGETLLVEVTSDRAGELHVHSKPEQYVEFGAGTTTAELVVDVPGQVEVEEHDTSAVVARLQVQ